MKHPRKFHETKEIDYLGCSFLTIKKNKYKQMKILIVDDIISNIILLEEILSGNHQTEKAYNGQDALDKINIFNPDLVLLDIMMPVIDGIATLKKIRANLLTSDLPVIMITAKQEYADLKEALNAGASDYIKKPIDKTELFTKIEIRNQLIHKSKKILDYEIYDNIQESMVVAQRFQQSLLPDKKKLLKLFPNNFVLNLPKDILSGDFYNFYNFENSRKLITLYDCIGHGAPAAMMTIAIQLIANNHFTYNSNYNLHDSVQKIIDNLKININQSVDTFSDFSFDAIFLEIIENEMTANFIGAHRPLLIVRKNSTEIIVNNQPEKPYITLHDYSLFRIKGNIHSIILENADFDNKKIKLEKGDSIYLFSDGYTEQMSSNFKKVRISMRGLADILIENQNLSMNEQKQILYDYFINNLNGSNQLDDIIVIGVKI